MFGVQYFPFFIQDMFKPVNVWLAKKVKIIFGKSNCLLGP